MKYMYLKVSNMVEPELQPYFILIVYVKRHFCLVSIYVSVNEYFNQFHFNC